MKNRILAGLLALLLCLGIVGAAGTAAGAQTFSDVSDPDTSDAVVVLSGLGIVSGYSDGSYHPSAALTRAQFCVLAVLAEGHGDQVRGSAYRTLFSDLPASHWAAPYVNLAQSEGLVSGCGNGTFGPDDPVTMGQAVTIVLRLMGYSTGDVGPFWPQDYMENAAALGLTDGISKTGSQAIDRGKAALLLYRMLRGTTRDGRDCISALAAGTVEDAVVLSNDAEAGDGALHTAQVYAGKSGLTWYEQSSAIPDALVNRRGTLLLDSSGKVTGYYESASPNTASPDSITLLGLTLEVDESAVSSLSSFKVGQRITVVLGGAGEVAYACSPSERTAQMVGLVTAAGDTCRVELFSGLNVSGKHSGLSVSVGDLVRVSSSGIGTISLSSIGSGSVSGVLNVAARTLGSVALADNVTVYDRAGKSAAVQVELEDILSGTVSASGIAYAGTDSDGRVNVIVLNDVTGDAYTYGILHTGTRTKGSGDMQVTNATLSVENSSGTSQAYITGSSVGNKTVGGLAVTSDGKTAGVITLEKVTAASGSAFDSGDAVVLNGVRVPISDDVQVYNADSGQWTTLPAARAYTGTFTVYYSGTLGDDAKVRVIFTG